MGSPSSTARAFASSARVTASTFRTRPASSTPVPRPHTAPGSAGRSAATTAAADVLFAMPISPMPTRPTPSAATRSTNSIPTATARNAWSVVIAGPCAAFAVPGPNRRLSTPGTSPRSERTPASTTSNRAPARRARTQTAAPPAAKFSTICAVTSCGYALTFSAAIPWSAATTITMEGEGAGAARPRMPATVEAIDSSRPRLPRGFVLASIIRSAAAAQAMSAPRILPTVAETSSPASGTAEHLDQIIGRGQVQRASGEHQHGPVRHIAEHRVDATLHVAERAPELVRRHDAHPHLVRHHQRGPDTLGGQRRRPASPLLRSARRTIPPIRGWRPKGSGSR